MTRKSRILRIVPLLLLFCSPLLSAEILHQALQVRLDPPSNQLWVKVELTLPETVTPRFLLHAGLNPSSPTEGVELVESGPVDGPVPLTAYRVVLPAGKHRFTLSYTGRIQHQPKRLKESPGRSSERLVGTISTEGVHLDGATAWYPLFPEHLQTFSLQVDLPEGWLAVSQGEGPELANSDRRQQVIWSAPHPQDEIYLIAAPFHYDHRSVGDIEAQVFLRQADQALAKRYLDASERYLRLYESLIGPYPYAKFALVENFWQTGYGMPSFTLLGSRVIRLPFILYTSYPHEILHNWWGNSVYVDYANGNWSEGLTSYLADHLLAEQQGRGSDYRRSALQRYADFVRHDNDFPLREFRGRHSTASQAVGYDKGLMLFHMLRRELGDTRFIAGLRRFYRDNRFKTAGFRELQAAFEAVSQRSLDDFFQQWVEREGAPALALEETRIESTASGYRLTGELVQTQSAAPYRLRIPLAISLEDGGMQLQTVEMTRHRQRFRLELPSAPRSLSVDPWFDLFRSLDPAETPASLSQFFGAERVLILLPAAADENLLRGYRTLAEAWAGDFEAARIALDSEVDRLPGDLPVLLLGWENRFAAGFLERLSDYPMRQKKAQLELWNRSFATTDHSFALAARQPASRQTQLWIATRTAEALPGLSRKLPHYGKYSALVFAGKVPDNRLKRQWPITGSPLQARFSSESPPLLPEPAPLAPARNAQGQDR
ncbi:MAG: M1 family aminopeptidase [Candidatus Thiodiazotropha sp.]